MLSEEICKVMILHRNGAEDEAFFTLLNLFPEDVVTEARLLYENKIVTMPNGSMMTVTEANALVANVLANISYKDSWRK